MNTSYLLLLSEGYRSITRAASNLLSPVFLPLLISGGPHWYAPSRPKGASRTLSAALALDNSANRAEMFRA